MEEEGPACVGDARGAMRVRAPFRVDEWKGIADIRARGTTRGEAAMAFAVTDEEAAMARAHVRVGTTSGCLVVSRVRVTRLE